jgi:hypothetical protein
MCVFEEEEEEELTIHAANNPYHGKIVSAKKLRSGHTKGLGSLIDRNVPALGIIGQGTGSEKGSRNSGDLSNYVEKSRGMAKKGVTISTDQNTSHDSLEDSITKS